MTMFLLKLQGNVMYIQGDKYNNLKSVSKH